MPQNPHPLRPGGRGATSSLHVVDSHCHLADARLRDEADEIIERARLTGVETMISVGAIDRIDTDRLAVAIAERNRGVYAVVGVHPHDAIACDDVRIAALRELAISPKVVAIGETGLDFHYMRSPQEAQEVSLRRHLELTTALDKPVVLHCRKAEQRLATIVREVGMPPRGGVIHCFTGDTASAQEFLSLGFYISFSGIVTFRNAQQVREAAVRVPADRLMVETDAPYLAPEPCRGQRNEPAYVMRTLEVLARIRDELPEALAKTTTENARRLFGLV